MPYGKPMMDDKKAAGKGKAAMPMKKGKKK